MFKKFLPLFLLALSISAIHAQTVAYVANKFGNTVSVIDTSTNTVTANIPVGQGPIGVVFSPDGARAYVTNFFDGTVSVIDTASNTVTATITLEPELSHIQLPAITPDGKSLYVPNPDHGLFVVSTATNNVVASIPGSSGFAVAITPDGTRAYVEDGSSNVAVIDTATNTVVTTITAVPQSNGSGIAVTPNGLTIYVTGDSAGVVSAIATSSNTVTATIPFPGTPQGIAVTPDGSRAYVRAFGFPGVVNIIDTSTNTLEPDTITVGNGSGLLAVTPDGAFVYVTNDSDNTVSVIATATNTVVATVTVGTTPVGIAIANLHAPTFETSSITANFNGTAIPSGDALWFSSVAKVSGLGSSPVTISVRHAAISYTLSGTNVTVPVPDADLTFNPSATTATTSFNTSNNRWQTTVPSQGLAGNVFLDGAELMLPNGLPGGVKNVTWTASFSSNTPGITVNWQWAAAAYSSLCGPDLTCLGVKPVDDNHASQYQNSDHAGTPENEKSKLVAGGTGGGGSNFTGGYSGTAAVKPAGPK